jgi:hypothetical membrane protein
MVRVTSRRRPLTTAGLLWVLAALVYLTAEAVTAGAFPGYSYADNYISDLGIPEVGAYEGRAIDSPLHAVMNTAFVVQGLLYLAAAVLVVRVSADRSRWLFVGLATAYAVGVALVGLIHGSQANAENGTAVFHVVGAALAIIGGNLAAIVAGVGLRGYTPPAYSAISMTLGVVGLIGLVMLQVDARIAGVDILPDGTWERIAVYTVTAWQLLTGVLLIRRRAGRSRRRLDALTHEKPAGSQ